MTDLSKGVSAAHVNIGDGSLDIDVVISLPIYIHLEVVVHLVGVVLVVQLGLHIIDLLLDDAILVDKIAAVSVDSIELLEDQIQTLLKRRIILLKLDEVLI